jgi:ribonucleoside-diphosphate reductase alpha chain
MYRYAWHTGLKTTYYLRTLGASTIEKSTVSKSEVAQPDPTPISAEPLPNSSACRWDPTKDAEGCEACQ